MSDVLKTPEEWDRELYPGSMVWDPDGWRKDGRPWTDPITREEFEERRGRSTIGPRLTNSKAHP